MARPSTMSSTRRPFRIRPAGLASLALAGLLAGCASTTLDAQWADSQQPLPSFSGKRVLVVCEAYEAVVQQVCEDRLEAELSARGAAPVRRDAGLQPDRPGDPYGEGQLLDAARAASADAVFVSSIVVGSRERSPGFTIGIGGFGIGGGRVGGGVGVSAPVGGGGEERGYVANGKLSDAASGRLVWTARASAKPSKDINAQMAALNQALVAAAQKSGLF